ncbi:LANO_0H01794g1_1 [Lachancea nothofagi CBS 11611]|uniref:LANO_0H01794g1_1 n=1 Tax=Lachancea nothofagi CBS 11611 TaxID=1266666 RepID=A0A1G4KL30_9SACH|nr:LANO_0H01794g1_1 [Lachancea nothofagi CBS 11611]
MGIFTGDDDKETKDYNDKLVSTSLKERLNDSFQSMGDSIFSVWKDAVHHVENPISDLWVNASGGVGDILAGLGFPGGFGHPARILKLMEDNTTQEGTTGLYGYRTPSDKQFMECQELKGLSVWDSRGWWRCLFPESVIGSKLAPEHMIDVLTREKVENDKNHRLGLFFTEYTSYLTWRTNILRLAENRRNSLAAKAHDCDEIQSIMATPEDLMDRATGKSVVGTSEYVTYNTTPEGLEKIKEVKTFYDDGSVKLRSEKQHRDSNGKSHIDSFEKIIADHDDIKDGWFWRK